MNASYRFTNAIVRRPGQSIADGLRASGGPNPDPEIFGIQHRDYIRALEEAGVSVEILPAWEDFPDSVFIEDSALCLPRGAIVMRPGAPSRTGEADAMAAVLRPYFSDVRRLEGPGYVDGGDILVSNNEIIVGLSERTDRAGVEELAAKVSDWGMPVRVLETPPGVLHFKTACGLLDAETILVTAQLDAAGFFGDYKTLVIPAGEESAANAVRVNDTVFLSDGFPKTRNMLTSAGFRVVALDTGEAAKVDGGLSCMSLRFSPTV